MPPRVAADGAARDPGAAAGGRAPSACFSTIAARCPALTARIPPSCPTFELAGPRDRIFFDPAQLRCGIVTCGGLCPGINNVIRGLVLELTHAYGVKDIFGFRYGFEGLVARLRPRAGARSVRPG